MLGSLRFSATDLVSEDLAPQSHIHSKNSQDQINSTQHFFQINLLIKLGALFLISSFTISLISFIEFLDTSTHSRISHNKYTSFSLQLMSNSNSFYVSSSLVFSQHTSDRRLPRTRYAPTISISLTPRLKSSTIP